MTGVPVEGPTGILGWKDLSQEYFPKAPAPERDAELALS